MRTTFLIGLAVDKTLNFVGDFFGFIFTFNFRVSSLNTSGVPKYHQKVPFGLERRLERISGRDSRFGRNHPSRMP